jgi:hypothetical protein
MYCISCGVVMPGGAKFCPNCGTAASEIAKDELQKAKSPSTTENIHHQETISALDRFEASATPSNGGSANSEKKLFGGICLAGGAGAVLFAIVRMNSTAVQFADAFGVKDNTGPMLLTVGIVVTVVGLVMISSK